MSRDADLAFDLGRLDDMLRDLTDETHVRGELEARARIRRYVNDTLLAAAAERDVTAREAARLRRAVALALDGPSDGEIGMETTLGRLNRIERQLRAALAPQEGATDGR